MAETTLTMPNYYTARSDDELRRLAEQQYQSYYDQLRLAAQQKSDRETTALEGQRAGILRSYRQQLDESAKQYRQAYSQTDRETLRRGMQRSSYAAQRLANVAQEGIEAGQRIQEAQTAAEGNLDAQIAQISGQLADTLAGYDAGQAADVLKRYNELQAEEYDRAREAEQYAESIRQYEQKFNESVRQFNILHPSSSGGGGSSYYGGRSSSSGRSSGTETNTNNTNSSNDSMLQKLVSGFGSTTKIAGKANSITSNSSTQKGILSGTNAIVKKSSTSQIKKSNTTDKLKGTTKSTSQIKKPNPTNKLMTK